MIERSEVFENESQISATVIDNVSLKFPKGKVTALVG